MSKVTLSSTRTRGLRLPLMRSCAISTTPVLKMKSRVNSSMPFFILPRSSLALSQFTVPYICSSPTFRSTTCTDTSTTALNEQAVRQPPRYAPAEALRAAEPTAPAHGNVAVGSHAQYVPTLTAAAAWRGNAAVSKAAQWPWPLTFWPWKWYPSHVWRGLPLCQF